MDRLCLDRPSDRKKLDLRDNLISNERERQHWVQHRFAQSRLLRPGSANKPGVEWQSIISSLQCTEAESVIALLVLRWHSLNDSCLQVVFQSVVAAKIHVLYGSPACCMGSGDVIISTISIVTALWRHVVRINGLSSCEFCITTPWPSKKRPVAFIL